MIPGTDLGAGSGYTGFVEKARALGRLTHWASKLFQKKAVPVVVPSAPVYADEARYLSAWQRFEAVQSTGKRVRMKTQLMSSHSMVYRSDRELNLGEVITVRFEEMEIAATVVHLHPTKRWYGGELELAPTPAQRATLLEIIICLQETKPVQPASSCVLARPVVRKSDKTRSRRIHSGSRKIRSISRTKNLAQ